MSERLSSVVLKLRLDVALALLASREAGLASLLAWVKVEQVDELDFEQLLIEAMLQVLPEDARLLAAITLAHTFVDRLTEARDGLL